jgi:hypothetical protein
MFRKPLVYPALLALSFALVLAALAAAANGNPPKSVLDQRGTVFTLSSQGLLRLRHSGVRRVFLLATMHGRSYYRLVRTGHVCYGVGRAGKSSWPGEIQCFPKQPALVDFSVVEVTRGHPLHLWRLEGMAADRFASIGIIDNVGRLIAKVSVTRGIYYLASPPNVPLRHVLAYDAAGQVIRTLW